MKSTGHAPEEHRLAPRFPVSQPVYVDDEAQASARNISEQGIYFVSPVPHEVGTTVAVTVEYIQGGVRHRLHFEGEVLRVEPAADGNGVAARLRTPFFAGEEQVVPPAG